MGNIVLSLMLYISGKEEIKAITTILGFHRISEKSLNMFKYFLNPYTKPR